MCSVWSQAKLKLEMQYDEVDVVPTKVENFESSNEDDSSSISGNDNFVQMRVKEENVIDTPPENPPSPPPPTSIKPAVTSAINPSLEPKLLQDVAKLNERRSISVETPNSKDRKLLILGMILAVLLAMFSSFLLLRINNVSTEPDFSRLRDFNKVSLI